MFAYVMQFVSADKINGCKNAVMSLEPIRKRQQLLYTNNECLADACRHDIKQINNLSR